jgi:hypothetical protein
MSSSVEDEDPFGEATEESSEAAQGATSKARSSSAKPPTTVRHSETSKARNASSMAQAGSMVSLEDYPTRDFPSWGDGDIDLLSYEPGVDIDISDLSAVSREILLARRRMFQVQRALTDAQRKAAETKFDHRRARNRYLIGLSGGTDKSREAMADVATEEEYGDMVVAEQVAADLLAQSRAVKAELDSLANLSHNIRAQINLS